MEVSITVDGTTEKDYYPRAHGFCCDQSLATRFWETQPSCVLIRSAARKFNKTILLDLPPGRHTVTYGISAHSSTPWETKISAGDVVLASGPNSYGNYLTASFMVLPGGRVTPVPALLGRIPFFSNLRMRIMSVFGR